MKFAPRPENDFREFHTLYFERCRSLFPRIQGIGAKWRFEDLLPGLSDFDTRLFCENGMTAADWIDMSLAVGKVHAHMTREFPQWVRILEHLPGLNLTWEELSDPVTYYPEFNQWTFYDGPSAVLEQVQNAIKAQQWTARDEYFHIKKFSVYYGPYQRGIDPPINLGVYESKYPLHSRIWHYLVTPLQSAVSILERRGIAGKMETLRLARERVGNPELVERLLGILEAHYEVPELCADPGLAAFEAELKAYLEAAYRTILPELTLFRGQPDDTPEALRARVAAVHVDPIQQYFEGVKFSRLMKGRLLFYAEGIPHFDSIPLIRGELRRIRANFYEKPLEIYGKVRFGEALPAAEVAARLRAGLWSTEEYEGAVRFAELAVLPENVCDYRRVACEVAANFDPFLQAMETLNAHVRADFA